MKGRKWADEKLGANAIINESEISRKDSRVYVKLRGKDGGFICIYFNDRGLAVKVERNIEK